MKNYYLNDDVRRRRSQRSFGLLLIHASNAKQRTSRHPKERTVPSCFTQDEDRNEEERKK